MKGDAQMDHGFFTAPVRNLITGARDCLTKAAKRVFGVASDANASIVSPPNLDERVFVAGGDCASIPEHRSALVPLIPVKDRDIVPGAPILLPKCELVPAQSFRIIPPHSFAVAEQYAEV